MKELKNYVVNLYQKERLLLPPDFVAFLTQCSTLGQYQNDLFLNLELDGLEIRPYCWQRYKTCEYLIRFGYLSDGAADGATSFYLICDANHVW